MKAILLRYRFFIVLLAVNAAILGAWPEIGRRSFSISLGSLVEMLMVLPPIFILLGLLDVWVEREAMIRLMGRRSGAIGIALAFFLGSAAAGPLYAAFPVAGVLLKKGASLFNVLLFIGAWSTTKIPLLLFEYSSMGWQFTILRFALDIPGILLIAGATDKALSDADKENIYRKAAAL